MLIHLKKPKWSPYIVGTLIGFTFLLSYVFFNKTIGSSTSFVKIAAFFHQWFDKDAVANTPYYQDYLKSMVWIDWQVALVFGIFTGAFLSVNFSKSKDKFCKTSEKLSKTGKLLAFIGGFLVIFGARLAGGCTSGHAISGGIQLAASGYIFMFGVFLMGIPTAFLARKLFKKDYI